MRLKLSRDIDWHDLPKIESPFFAARDVEYGDSYGDKVRGLDILGSGSSLSKKDQLRKIVDGLESGRIYLLKHNPTSPVFRWVKKNNGKGYWELSESFGLTFDMSAEYMLRHIIRQHHHFLEQRQKGLGAAIIEEPDVAILPARSSQTAPKSLKKESPDQIKYNLQAEFFVEEISFSNNQILEKIFLLEADYEIEGPKKLESVSGAPGSSKQLSFFHTDIPEGSYSLTFKGLNLDHDNLTE